MSLSESYAEKKHKFVYFHGKNIHSKKFQKRINRKSNLSRVILVNILIISVAILTVWFLMLMVG